MKYQPPYQPGWPNVPDPLEGYTNANPPAGIEGSVPPAEAFEYPMREIANLITYGGYIPTDDDLAQITRGVRRAKYAFATDTGTVNALSCAVDPPLLAYEQGTELRILVNYDNTGPSTIRVNGLPAAQIVRKDGTALLPGDLRLGGVAVLVYDGANFQLVSGTTGSVTITGGWFNGADWIVDTGTVNHIAGSPPIAPTAYSAGQGYTILVKNDNTGPVDINVNALGAKPLKNVARLDLKPGDIKANCLLRVWYDGTNFYMLSPIYMAIIDTAIAFVVGPNAGADFPDLITAMAWANRRRISQNGSLTFNLQGATSGAALIHNYTQTVHLDHPDGDRLTISGPAPAFIPTVSNFTSTGVSAAAINADSNSNVNMLRTAFRCELRFTGCSGLRCVGRVGLLQNLLVTGGASLPLSGTAYTGIGISGSWTSINCVASAIWGSCTWYIDMNAGCSGGNFYAVGSQFFSVGMAHSANLIMSSTFMIAGAYVDGIQAAHGAIGQANRPAIFSCGQSGLNHWGSSSFHMEYLYELHIGWYGVLSTTANCYCAFASISYCNVGFYASQNGMIDCDTAYVAAAAALEYGANVGGILYASAYQVGSSRFSPAKNTFGNSGAYITA
jgi:hypothetical protein